MYDFADFLILDIYAINALAVGGVCFTTDAYKAEEVITIVETVRQQEEFIGIHVKNTESLTGEKSIPIADHTDFSRPMD